MNKSNPSELLRIGEEIMPGKDDTRYYFRVFSMNLVHNGISAASIAEITVVSSSTVSSWFRLIDLTLIR